MGNNLNDYIKTFEFLSPNPVVVIDKNYKKVYNSQECDEATLKIFVKHLKKNSETNFRIKLENGNIFSSSQVMIVHELYYLVSIERIDSNPLNFNDPLLKKISFFLAQSFNK